MTASGARPIYLDHNATTPVDPRVFEAMRPWFCEEFGNPSSAHPWGRRARAAVERAREQLAALIGARSGRIVFTGGGSEANNLAIKGVAAVGRGGRRRLVGSAIEHPAVSEPLAALARHGFEVVRVGVDRRGIVDPDALRSAIDRSTLLVSVMHANNEVGTVQPIGGIAAVAHAAGALLHSDAAQSVGKIPVDVGRLGVDLLTIAAHKFHGPKGVGALWIRDGVDLARQIDGAAHEHGLRAGTENVPGIVGPGAAAEIAGRELAASTARVRALRDRLRAGLERALGPLTVHGDPDGGLPNTLSVALGVPAAELLAALDGEVAASAGAACHDGGAVLSPVLAALGVPSELARGTVRLSVGRTNTEAEVDRAVERIVAAVRRIR